MTLPAAHPRGDVAIDTFEWIIVLLLGAALLAALARKVGAPYPTFLAIGGALLAFVPASPRWTLDPRLALTLFVAPILMDAAYDTSLRDLRRNWKPVAGLVIAAVATTVIAVALAARWLVPGMPWPVAIALGAIVAPPDAAAATAVMRQVGLPHKLLKILEGESLLNDASALLVYRLAIMAMLAGHLGVGDFAPVFLLTVFGSLVAGIAAAFALRPLTGWIRDVPISLIVQFATTFGVWIGAEALGLSGILTMVAFAMTVARRGVRMPARMRIPVLAVWEAVVFVLNAFAFVLIGMQLRPIWERLATDGHRSDALLTAGAVLAVTILARFAWVMAYHGAKRASFARAGDASRPAPRIGNSIVLSWAGMRGIVTLAAAFAIPETLHDGTPFPYRDLILLCAFAVVLGTLVLQGLTIAPLIRRVGLVDDDTVGREVRHARGEVYRALLDSIRDDESHAAVFLRKEYGAVVRRSEDAAAPEGAVDDVPGGPLRRQAIAAAQQRAFELRRDEVIGDDAYRVLVQELDWAELNAGGNRGE